MISGNESDYGRLSSDGLPFLHGSYLPPGWITPERERRKTMANLHEDTIAAAATAMSASGIGIIRISGPDAIRAADLVYRSPKGKTKLSEADSHTIHYGFAADADGRVLDEVLVSVMRAPKTYTAEDTVEINCHGGVLAMRRVLDAVIATDGRRTEEGDSRESVIRMRIADPGEFTRRAFLNGRIDLSRAEAVMDLIEAKNEYALDNSVSQLRGSLYRKITELRGQILYQIAHIEASLDDPEHLDFTPHIAELAQAVSSWRADIRHLIDTAQDGRLAAEGIRTVIVGKPNAGKSSLLNLILGQERAIVTEIAGTTRDVLTETVNIQGITLLVTDTAGIRQTRDQVEKIGVERAKKSAADADLLLWIVDSSVPLDEDDAQICSLLQDRPAIVLLNKSDLDTVVEEADIRKLYHAEKEPEVISISAANGTGLEKLVKALKDMFFSGKLSWNDEVIITNMRHCSLLQKAEESLKRVKESMNGKMSEDFFSIDLMDAYEALGGIIGEEIGDDLADEIFSRFCMGK